MLFERKWLLDENFYYMPGDAVWMYLVRPEDILKNRRDHVLKYLNEAPDLVDWKKQYEAIDKEDSDAVDAFLVKLINEKIYVLGDTNYSVQIKVAKRQTRNVPSVADDWYDFYEKDLVGKNRTLLFSTLSS